MRKGISPLIATAILLLITFTAGAMVQEIVREITRKETTKVERKGEMMAFCGKINLDIEKAIYYKEKGEIHLLTRNNGKVNLTNFKIYVYSDETTVLKKIPENYNKRIPPGDYIKFVVENITQNPMKMSITSLEKNCPLIQPIDKCFYSYEKFIC